MRIRKIVLLLSVVLFGMISPAMAVGLEDSVDLETFFDGMLAIQMRESHVPGVTVAVVKDGDVVFSKGYGYARLGEMPMDAADSLVRPGSASKLFVWTSVMQMVEEGRIDLEANINEYLDFEIPDVIVRNGRAIEAEPITMKHLMNHTAGFEDRGVHLFILDFEQLRPLGQYLQEELPARIYHPGELIAYSNYGSSLAAYIVERVAGQPFYEYVEQNIFEPLQMERSSFRQPLPSELEDFMSAGYRYIDGRYVEGDFEICQSYPAGGLSSTSGDMAKFMIAHLQLGEYGEGRILQKETARQMQTQSYTSHPDLDGMAHGFIEMNINGQRILSHGGDTFLFHSSVFLFPEEDAGLFISYNEAGSAFARASLLRAFVERYFPASREFQGVGSPTLSERAPDYAGVYYSSRNNLTNYESFLKMFQPFHFMVSSDGFLLVRTAFDTVRYAEVERGVFQSLLSEGKLRAVDDQGNVTHFLRSGPDVLIRAPWYGTSTIFATVIGLSIILFLGSILGWIASFFARRRNFQRPKGTLVPKLIATAYLGILIGFLLLFGSIFINTHPVFGVPLAGLEMPAAMGSIMLLPKALVVISTLMLLSSLALWWKKRGSAWFRLQYSFLVLVSFAANWLMWYWALI